MKFLAYMLIRVVWMCRNRHKFGVYWHFVNFQMHK